MRVIKVRLYPNKDMQQVLINMCDYRRFCWNQALTIWNDMLDNNLKPTGWEVAQKMISQKADWQNEFSDRCLKLATIDLATAWRKYHSIKNFGKPKYKSKKASRQGFKIDDAKIIGNKLRLNKPRLSNDTWKDIPFHTTNSLDGKLKQVSVYCENNKFWANLLFDVRVPKKVKTYRKTAIDVNIGHFTYSEGKINVFPESLQKLYNRITHYHYILYKKQKVNGANAINSNNYVKTINKLQRDCRKIDNIQKDIAHKFTSYIVNNYDEIAIEDFEPAKFQMRYAGSKSRHRNIFRNFRSFLIYKCDWYGRKLVIADKSYPSTQRCSNCGHIKTGKDKITLNGNRRHGTNHSQYICYECGMEIDRDTNAVLNLLQIL